MSSEAITILQPAHEVVTIGETDQRAFTGVSARVQLPQTPTVIAKTYLLRSDQDVRIRQGSSTVTATVTDFLLTANTYLKIIVTNVFNDYIAAITPTGGTNGTLDVTILSDNTP